jgi:hypothetical protein
MTAQPVSGTDHPFLGTLSDAHQHALDALEANQPLDAVVWLSAHLAACQRTVHRAAAHLPAAARALQAQRSVDFELEHALRRAEQHHAGDSLAAQLNEDRLDAVLRRALDAHSDAERVLVAGLIERIDAHDVDELVASYDHALRHAPTRPHPHMPHRGVLGAVAFKVDAIRDKVMDTMDGRHVPAPRKERRPARTGRWGSYVLGEMHVVDE